MPFNPPGIIGGGSIISPAVQNDPFKGINDAITRARDRKLKDKALQLEAYNIYADAEKNATAEGTEFPDFKTWYKDFDQTNPNESQASIGGFFGMLGETAMSGLDGIGRIGKNLYEQGKIANNKEIEAINNQRDASNNSGTNLQEPQLSSDPVKQQNQIKSTNDGVFKKALADNSANLTTSTNEFKTSDDTNYVFDPAYEELEQWKGRPSPQLSTTKKIGDWIKKISLL